MADVQRFLVRRAPFGKVRAHPFVVKGHARMHNDDRNGTYEACVRSDYLAMYPDAEPYAGPVEVRIKAFFEIPKKWSKKKKQLAREGKIWPTVKYDADNLAKAICDALNGLAYIDDKQVVLLLTEKLYVTEEDGAPCSFVTIERRPQL